MHYLHAIPSVVVLSFALLTGLTGCSLPGKARPDAGTTPATQRQVELFYVTNRAPSPDSKQYFSTARGELSYGISSIGIPPGHVMGRHEEPSLLKFEWSPDAHKHIKLLDVSTLSQDDFEGFSSG